MNTVRRVVCLLLLGVSLPSWADCTDPFGSPDEVLVFHLEVTRGDWDTLRNAPEEGEGCQSQYPWVTARFRCGESEPWLNIGVRRKRGDQRGKDTDQKPPLKLDFNRVTKGQRWPSAQGDLGYRKLSLNNGQQSKPGGVLPALLSEHVAWQVMKEVLPEASGVSFARLFVHVSDEATTEYHGTYVLIEDLDRTAMKRRYGAACGRLLKTTDLSCPDEVEYDDGAPNPTSERYRAWFALKPGAESREQASTAFALDDLLRQEASRDILGGGVRHPSGNELEQFLSIRTTRGRSPLSALGPRCAVSALPGDLASRRLFQPRLFCPRGPNPLRLDPRPSVSRARLRPHPWRAFRGKIAGAVGRGRRRRPAGVGGGSGTGLARNQSARYRGPGKLRRGVPTHSGLDSCANPGSEEEDLGDGR